MENEPTLQQPQPTPEQPPQPSNKLKLPLIIGGAVLGLIVILGLLFFFVFSKNPSTSILAPKPVIKVGDKRYMDPCRLLPSEKVAEYFGAFGDKSYVREEFFDKSVPAKDIELGSDPVKCDYIYGDELGTYLRVEVAYFEDNKAALAEWEGPLKLALGEHRKQIESQRSGADPGPDFSESLALFDQTTQSVAGRLEQNYSGILASELGPTIVFVPAKMTFSKVIGDTVVKLSYAKTFDNSNPFTSTALKPHLPSIKKAFATIETNTKDTKLSQEPIDPTPLGKDPIGSIKVFDPCKAFSAETFKKATGNASGPSVSLKTVNRKAAEGDSKIITSECERSARKIGGEEYSNDNANVRFSYTKKPEMAKKLLENSIATHKASPDRCTVTNIQTETGTIVVVKDKDQANKSCNNRDFAYVAYGPYFFSIYFKGDRENKDLDNEESLLSVEKHFDDESYAVVAKDVLKYIKSQE